MLTAAQRQDFATAVTDAIESLGSPATWTQTEPPGATAEMTVGFRYAGREDVEIVNTVGVGAVIITAPASAFPVPPRKFDRFAVGGEVYVVNTAHPVAVGAAVVGYKVVARGHHG